MIVNLQTQRRSNPYPWTWELPTGIAVLTVLVLVLGIHVGRTLAVLLAGGGWVTTRHAALFTSTPAILSGDAAAGLTTPPAQIAGPTLLWCAIAVVELVVVAGLIVAAVQAMRRWGPGRVRGMATSSEIDTVLGLSRLRRSAPIIRPDLHPRREPR